MANDKSSIQGRMSGSPRKTMKVEVSVSMNETLTFRLTALPRDHAEIRKLAYRHLMKKLIDNPDLIESMIFVDGKLVG